MINLNKIGSVLILILLASCSGNYNYNNVDYDIIDINEREDSLINSIIKPYRDSITYNLDKVIGYSDDIYSITDYGVKNFNSTLGNLVANIIFVQADSIFFDNYNKNIDFVLQNHGGIRSSLLKGDVKLTDAYKILPFENEIVVLEISKEVFNEMIHFLKNEDLPHPFQGFKIVNDKVIINEYTKTNDNYLIATNDYLLSGGDNMFFLKENSKTYWLGYSLRDAFIDYIIKNKNLSSKIDDRFIK